MSGQQAPSASDTYTMGYSEDFDEWHRRLDGWKDAPGAVAAFAWREATGRG